MSGAPSAPRAAFARRSPVTSAPRSCARPRSCLPPGGEEISDLITAESGLCKKDTLYEVGRACDVFTFAANAALSDDGQIFSCDITPHGKKPARSTRSASRCARSPPSPRSTIRSTRWRTRSRPRSPPTTGWCSSRRRRRRSPRCSSPTCSTRPACRRHVLGGDRRSRARSRDELFTNADVELITFTGGVEIGKHIAGKLGYRRAVLELGGNDPLIVMEDADLEEAAAWRCRGSYKNSGQRCTAVKRIIVHESRRRPLSSTCWSRRPGGEVRRSDGPDRRHGHRDRREGRALLRGHGERRRSRAAPSCCTATSARARSIARPCSTTSRRLRVGDVRDLRSGLPRHPLQATSRTRSASPTPPPMASPPASAPTASTTSPASSTS